MATFFASLLPSLTQITVEPTGSVSKSDRGSKDESHDGKSLQSAWSGPAFLVIAMGGSTMFGQLRETFSLLCLIQCVNAALGIVDWGISKYVVT